jgi:hypothetical protein
MVRIVADGVNLRSELLPRSFRIFIGLGAVMPVATLEARQPAAACPKRPVGAIVKPTLPRYDPKITICAIQVR